MLCSDNKLIAELMIFYVENGVKYNESEKPQVFITCSEDQKEGAYQFIVRDNGIGIKEEMHDVIFKMFKRVHSRSKYKGTGIGLAVCKKIVEKHDGQIGVDSSQGQGSTFWFTIKKVKEAVLV